MTREDQEKVTPMTRVTKPQRGEQNSLPYLFEWRAERQYSIRELAQRSGVSATTIWRIEEGYPAHPETARKIAKALDIPVSVLRTKDVDPMEPGERQLREWVQYKAMQRALLLFLSTGDDAPHKVAWRESLRAEVTAQLRVWGMPKDEAQRTQIEGLLDMMRAVPVATGAELREAEAAEAIRVAALQAAIAEGGSMFNKELEKAVEKETGHG
jgi:transcriptional regulator with XRE-family HTH domain